MRKMYALGSECELIATRAHDFNLAECALYYLERSNPGIVVMGDESFRSLHDLNQHHKWTMDI